MGIVLPAGFLSEFLLVFSSVFLHEAGHMAAALWLGGRVLAVRILPVGLNADVEDGCIGRMGRLLVFASGPLVNMILCLLGFSAEQAGFLRVDTVRYLISANLGLMLFNLLPILPLDGGHILQEWLAGYVGIISAGRQVRAVSRILAAVLTISGVMLLFYRVQNVSLFLAGIYIFFALESEGRETALMNMKRILFRRSRIIKKGIFPARDLVALKTVRLGEILRALDYDRFHFIHILDEELRQVCTITEQEVMDALVRFSSDMTFGDLLDARSHEGMNQFPFHTK